MSIESAAVRSLALRLRLARTSESENVLDVLARDPEEEVKQAVFDNPHTSEETRRQLCAIFVTETPKDPMEYRNYLKGPEMN